MPVSERKAVQSGSSQSPRHKGTVRWFNHVKGYGFIASDTALPGKKDVFVHYSGVSMSGYRKLVEGQEVEFTVEAGAKGPQAASVVVLSSPPGVEEREYVQEGR